MKDKFEVKNNDIQTALRKFGEVIKNALPKGWGFTLLIFDYSKPGDKDAGSMFYISSANRKDVVKSMMEFIDKQQEGQSIN